VLKKLLRVQEVLLAVNQQYIRSASQDENYRTEPRFQLQGSLPQHEQARGEGRPVMNDAGARVSSSTTTTRARPRP
jgi:hypothetical protein